MSLDDRNAKLEKQLEVNPIDENIQALIRADARRKRQVFLLFLSIAFDLLLTVALAFGWQQNHNLAIRAESNRQAIIRSCETTNEARANNKKLWDYVLNLPSDPQATPEQQKSIAQFREFVNMTFAPRDCNKVVEK